MSGGEVDCWGDGFDGQLGNGRVYGAGHHTPAVPVRVEGAGGTGVLTGASSLTGDGGGTSFCAVVSGGAVDCWGDGTAGQLGNGKLYSVSGSDPGSAVPVSVKGVGGSGLLAGVDGLISDDQGYCALRSGGEFDCWGDDHTGELGSGRFYPTSQYRSPLPVQVVGIGGSGPLTGASQLTGEHAGFCAVVSGGGVGCWGAGGSGQLGNGQFYVTGNGGSAVPVAVR